MVVSAASRHGEIQVTHLSKGGAAAVTVAMGGLSLEWVKGVLSLEPERRARGGAGKLESKQTPCRLS